MDGVQLQAGPSDSSPGNYIHVPGLSGSANDIAGTFWNLQASDATSTGAFPLYIAAVEKDTSTNLSKYPSNDDVYLYTVYYRQPATGRWASLCPLDAQGKARALAVPLNFHAWESAEARRTITFACTASGVAAKCARNWGYKPWKTVHETVFTSGGIGTKDIPLAPLYDACLIAARADYCQDGASYTKNGTLVDLFDTLDGFTSINATSGLPYAPKSSGYMMHEEYQISALDLATVPPSGSRPASAFYVKDNFCSAHTNMCGDEWDDLSSEDRTLVANLRRSGMESSRYDDRDPGRSCSAAPYIDRCDPREPYACYRNTNLSSHPYGAFLAVNSPRHCSHNELADGEALDPLCNECVNRVCKVDASCCGDPGPGFYPGSLVWDQRCRTIRDQVCKSTPTSPLWPAGQAAPVAGSSPVKTLRGAIGELVGLVCEGGTGADCVGGTQYAEGWSCDPDHPGAANPVQISLGGELGATAVGGEPVPLHTTTAGLPLATAVPTATSSWRQLASDECGGGDKHGFRFAIPAGYAGKDVYVYGIDLDVPGAPFSLLRGGKKTLSTSPPQSATAVTNPRAAIWTGWIEAPSTDTYTFCKQTSTSQPTVCAAVPQSFPNPTTATVDLYRIWVNGIYVGGNWKDVATDPPTTGAFTLSPPDQRAPQVLRKGVRYPVRIEYLRPASLPVTSQFALLWKVGGASYTTIPSSALYPMAQVSGTGLRGSYYKGTLPNDVGNASDFVTTTTSAVDFLWSGQKPPVVCPDPDMPCFGVNDTFAASFEGQVVPPISGDYTFTAETDGTARIYVRRFERPDAQWELVTAATSEPVDDDTCSHDICQPGAAVSRACRQQSFCSAQVCLKDAYCCAVTWDAHCVQRAKDLCNLDCNPTPPIPVPLAAGERYDVRVEYQHIGGTPQADVYGAKLRLMWAIAGTLRDVVPVERLFSEPAGDASGQGVGLNAAYFKTPAPTDVCPPNNPWFCLEYLDRVDGQIAYLGTAARPHPRLSSSIICTTALCAGAPSAPALVAARVLTADTTTVAAEIVGRGVVDGANVELRELVGDPPAPTKHIASFSVPAGPPSAIATLGGPFEGGTFTQPATLDKGHRRLVARQTTAAGVSAWSAVLEIEAIAPGSPAAPWVNAPPEGLVSGNGTVRVAGTATPGSTVKVKLGNDEVGSTVASAAGTWTVPVQVPTSVGNVALTVTTIAGGVESATGASVIVKVALPPLKLTSPVEGAVLEPGELLSIQGSGAVSTLGDIHIGDGDGRYFEPRDDVHVATDGTFQGGAVSLDPGRHQIKVYQRNVNFDADGVVRNVFMRPPVVSNLSPGAGTIVASTITVTGSGLPRTGLPGMAFVSQNGVRKGEGPIEKDGSFAIPIRLVGGGEQTFSVTQVASSLSGGGLAESRPTSVTVRVIPDAPKIDSPVSGGSELDMVADVAGTALPNATITLLVDGVARPGTATADSQGHFVFANVALLPGTRKLQVTQTVMGATSAPSPITLVSAGDVTPPTILVLEDPDCVSNCATTREVVEPTTNEDGKTVVFADRIRATDCDADGSSCVSLPVTCRPASGSHFLLGSTTVTCDADDSTCDPALPGCDPAATHGNHASASFVVKVKNTVGPSLNAIGLLAEAQGPEGAVVDYQITADGFQADCSPPGSGEFVPCTFWEPSHKGLGFGPSAIGIDLADPTVAADGKRHGALYVGFSENIDPTTVPAPRTHFLKSSDGGSSWTELTRFADNAWVQQIVVGPGSPASLYVAIAGASAGVNPTGIRISRDGGLTWSVAIDDQHIERLAADPSNAAHMLAVGWSGSNPLLFETHDSWATWVPFSTAGLPPQSLGALAIDSANPKRLYASVRALASEPVQTKLYRKVGAADWERLDVPPYNGVVSQPASSIVVSPHVPANHAFPTVFAGPVVSGDGGETWAPVSVGSAQSITFDRTNPKIVFATTSTNIFRAPDADVISPISGVTFFPRGAFSAPVSPYGSHFASIVQDGADPGTLYSAAGFGLYKTENSGQTWVPVLAPGVALPGVEPRVMAFDPVDPNRSYLRAGAGLYRNDRDANGRDNWISKTTGILDPFVPVYLDWIHVDAFERNKVSMGGFFGAPWTSPDGADNWTASPMVNVYQVLGVDPTRPDTVYFSTNSNASPNADGHWPLRFGAATSSNSSGFNLEAFPDDLATIARFQFARHSRTVVVTWDGSEGGRTGLFTIPQQGSTDIVTAGINTRLTFLDSSSGADHLFFGGDAIGQSPFTLYRARLGDGQVEDPVALGNVDGYQSSSLPTFQQLHHDPMSGGQVMYTTAGPKPFYDEDHDQFRILLWESRDGGRTWRPDASTPPHLTQTWLSPVDGVVYANSQESLWRRLPTAEAPPGARIVRTSMRPTCTSAEDAAIAPGSLFGLGATPINCKVTDVFGTPTTRTFDVFVQDTTPPKVSVPASIDMGDTGPTAVDFAAKAPLTPIAAKDLVAGDVPVTCVPASGETFQVGVTIVNCTATDGHNTGRASFPVYVSAPSAPRLTVPGDVTIEANHAPGALLNVQASATTANGTPLPPPTCTPALSSVFLVGSTDVSCSATDAGLTVEKSFRVTVTDTQPPELTVPSDFSVEAQGAVGREDLQFVATALDQGDGTITPTCVPEIGATFPLGKTLVTCRAIDRAGHRATETFNVTVTGLPPKLSLFDPPPYHAEDQLGARVTYPAFHATDTAGHALDAGIRCVPESSPGSPTWFPIGKTEVSCSVLDGDLRETRGSFTVSVVDADAPTVTVPPAMTVKATSASGAVVTFGVSAFDLVDGDCKAGRPCGPPVCTGITNEGQSRPVESGAPFPVGETTVTCRAIDGAGNPGQGSFVVRVVDTTPPELTVADVHEVADVETATKLVMSFPVNATDDITVGPIPIACTPKAGSVFVPGTTVVTCVARDGSGNETTKTLEVVITRFGGACTQSSQCGGGACVDGVCCDTACGGGLANDCQACSVAAGAAVNGVCGPVRAAAAVVCRPSAGTCDVAETCDGASAACPADAVKTAATECRASAGGCDVAETCDGSAAVCPGDTKRAAGFECRVSAGGCDVAETCDGSASVCPGDTKRAAGFECRASAGGCDVAETCDGSAAVCPSDTKRAAGFECRASAGGCDVAETCDGSAAVCPGDIKRAAGFACRPSAAACDLAEACNGVAATCPVDAKVPTGTQCRASAGACDPAEACNGGNDCPANVLAPAGTVCAPASGTCQLPGLCSGSAATCPGTTPKPGCCADPTPPVFSNVPATIVAYATSTAGAVVSYTKPTATDAVDGVRTVTCTVASGGTFAPGKKTVTCTASDKCNNVATTTFTVWVQYKAPADGSFFLFPIRADNRSVFKIGRPVPARFYLSGPSAGIKNLVAKFAFTKVSNDIQGTADSVSDETDADTDMTFKYRPILGWYAYRWKTTGQTKGTYQLRADLGDGVVHQINVSLKP